MEPEPAAALVRGWRPESAAPAETRVRSGLGPGNPGKLSGREERTPGTALLGRCATLRGDDASPEPGTRSPRVSGPRRVGAAEGLSSALGGAGVNPREESRMPKGGCGLAQQKRGITTGMLVPPRTGEFRRPCWILRPPWG